MPSPDTGSPGPVDVHVNGMVISNLVYGRASAPVTFDARAANGDSLVVVPTGVIPDGNNGIWQSMGTSLFLADRDYEAIMGHTPMARFGEADELAGAVVWLASESASSFVTGTVIRVDGGFTAMTI